MNDLKQIIASNISKLRKQKKLTQLEFAKALNYSDKAISKWERAESIPDIIILKQIADLFGVTVDYIINEHSENEKILVRIENEIAKMGADIVTIPKDKEILQHASSQDLMLMIDLLQPKYYMPVKGDYRYMVNNADLASALGIKPENIILKQNGEVVTIKDGKLLESQETIPVNETLIDGNSNDDVGELVIKDREMLGENGIVLISVTLSKQTKKILVGPEIITRGFIYVKDSKEMIEEIKKISLSIVERNVNDNYVDYNNIKLEIREHLSKYFYHETECKPMIIAVIQEV